MPILTHGGADFYWDAAGPSSAPGLLLLHAGIATSAMWDEQWMDLSRDHRVVRYDLRWFGRTRSDDVSYSNRADALAVLEAAELERATLIGASYGGGVAIDVALEYPHRVSGLVTVGSGPGGFPQVPLTAREEELFDAIDAAEEAREWNRLVALEAEFWGAGPTREPANVDRVFLTRLIDLGRANLAQIQNDASPDPMTPAGYERLGDIRAPALVMVGDHDIGPARAKAEHLATHIPDATLHIFRDAAHLPSLEHPERFTAVLRDWLESHGL